MSNHKDFINSESLVLTVPEAAKLLRKQPAYAVFIFVANLTPPTV